MSRILVLVVILSVSAFAFFRSEANFSLADSLSPIQNLAASLLKVHQASLVIEEAIKGTRAGGPFTADRLTTIRVCSQQKLISTDWLDSAGSPDHHNRTEYLCYSSGAVLTADARVDNEGNEKKYEDERTSVSLVLSDASLVSEDVFLLDEDSIYKAIDGSAMPLGFYGYAPLSDYLEGKIVREEQTPEGYIIETHSDRGTLLLTLDPEHGWLPLQVEVRKESNDLVFDGPVSDFFILPESLVPVVNPSSKTKNSQLVGKQMSWVSRTTAFAKSADGAWYPSEIEESQKSTFTDGSLWQTKSTIKVREVDIKDKQCKFSFDIPIGLQVTVAEAFQLPYKWDGTKAVPGVPDFPSESGYNTSPLRRSKLSYILWFNLIVLVSIVIFVIVKYFIIPRRDKR